MNHILHRHSHSVPPQIASGDGVYLIDNQGKRYLDACGGAAVSCLGHSNQVVKEAIKKQIDDIHKWFGPTEYRLENKQHHERKKNRADERI